MAENRIISFEKNKCWINGNEFFGTAEEGSVEAKRKMLDYDGMAMPAPVKIPSGKLEAMTAKLKVKLSDPLVLTELSKNRGFVEIRLKGKAAVMNSTQGFVNDEDITTRIRGFVEEIPAPTHKDGEIPSKEFTINALYLEVSRNGSVILKVDVSSGEVVPKDLV